MSDDDFVAKPLKTYKRRRRAPPQSTLQTETFTSIEKDVLPSLKATKFSRNSVVVSPDKTGAIFQKTQCNKLSPVRNRITSAGEMTELDAFLSNKSDILGKAVFTESSFPELEIETVVKDEYDAVESVQESKHPVCKTEQKIPCTKERITDIKAATRSLCEQVKGKNLKQSSLFGVLSKGGNTSKPESRVTNAENQSIVIKKEGGKIQLSSDKVNPKLVSKGPLKQLDLFGNPPKPPLDPNKKLIKQAGTSQLDLGAMMGLKPKHPPPVKTKPNPPNQRKVPYHKWVRGTTFTVDAFNFGEIPKCTAYFLSHFHSDHYMGLNKHFTGVVYCSKVTSNYVINNLKVSPDRVRVLEFEKAEFVQGVRVSLLHANHCPGAAMFIFQSPTMGTILHTGDFRYNRDMLSHPLLKDTTVDLLYLDTTYMDPEYRFPPQDDVIQYMVGEVLQFTRDTLVVCGSYTIGKERIVEGIAKVLDCKICVNQTKMNLIKMQENDELSARLTKNINARVHIVPMKEINPGSLSKLLARTTFSSVVGVKPTGWTHSQNSELADIKPSGSGKVRIYAVPYSEHSSYSELEEFVTELSVKKVISTVMPRGEEKRKLMFETLKQWTSRTS